MAKTRASSSFELLSVEETTIVTRQSLTGFVGLGNLGQAMSLNLIDKGWPLIVLDRSERRVRPLVSAGAEEVDAAGLAAATLICFALPDEVAINAVLEAGLLARLTPQHTLIVHSTIVPDRARQLAHRVRAESGAHYIDAPVSGGAERARRGELSLLLGGSEEDIVKASPIFDDLADHIFALGSVGAASATKLANQLIMFSALAGVHEALALTQKFGVADRDVLRAVETGTGDTWVGRNWGFFDRVAADYDEAGVPIRDRPWSKDLWEIQIAARDAELSLPVAAVLSQTLAGLVEGHASGEVEKKGITS
jgi:3-hydroxyisobutyrate dehydrogenase-like beta-hydroxyacid dehydrogenase